MFFNYDINLFYILVFVHLFKVIEQVRLTKGHFDSDDVGF